MCLKVFKYGRRDDTYSLYTLGIIHEENVSMILQMYFKSSGFKKIYEVSISSQHERL